MNCEPPIICSLHPTRLLNPSFSSHLFKFIGCREEQRQCLMHHAVSGVQSVRGSVQCAQDCFTCRKYQTTTAARLFERTKNIYTKQKITLFSVGCNKRLVPGCGVVADHLLSSCLSLPALSLRLWCVCVDFDEGTSGQGQKCHTGNQSLNAALDARRKRHYWPLSKKKKNNSTDFWI